MIKRILTMVLFILIATLLLAETETVTLFFEGFEDTTFPPTADWYQTTFYPNNGTEWERLTTDEITPLTGLGVAGSRSYCEDGCSWPCNYLITPRIDTPDADVCQEMILEFYVAAAFEDDFAEMIQILVSAHPNQQLMSEYPEELTIVLESTEWTRYEVDLSMYIGSPIYIAFYHIYNEEELPHNILLLDDVHLYAEVEIPETGNDSDTSLAPKVSLLNGNFPNPFNPSTTISFYNATAGNVQIDVFNLKGQKITTLTNTSYDQGEHIVHWNGTDSSGKAVSSGIYLYQMKKDDFVSTKKMILMK